MTLCLRECICRFLINNRIVASISNRSNHIFTTK